MRHRIKTVRLDRDRKMRKSLIRGIVTEVILYDSVTTTNAKARAARRYVDRMITMAKRQNKLNAIRSLNAFLCDQNASRKVLEVLLPKYQERSGGYTRLTKLPPRRGDGAELINISLV